MKFIFLNKEEKDYLNKRFHEIGKDDLMVKQDKLRKLLLSFERNSMGKEELRDFLSILEVLTIMKESKLKYDEKMDLIYLKCLKKHEKFYGVIGEQK